LGEWWDQLEISSGDECSEKYARTLGQTSALRDYGDDYSGQPSQLIHFTSPQASLSLPLDHYQHHRLRQHHILLPTPTTTTFTMDQLQISPETQQGLQNLSAKDKQELNQFIVGETQKAQVQSSMSRLSSLHACAFIKLAYACL
jgi:hypothetical protein